MTALYEFDDLGVSVRNAQGTFVGFAGDFQGEARFTVEPDGEIEFDSITIRTMRHTGTAWVSGWVTLSRCDALFDLIELALRDHHDDALRANWSSSYPDLRGESDSHEHRLSQTQLGI